MDPADSATLHQALVVQSAQIGQHDKVLTKILSSLQELSANVAGLLQGSPVPSAHPSTSLTSTPADCSVPLPFMSPMFPSSCYSGDIGHCSNFLLQCSIVFDLQPLTYASNRAKIVVNLLLGWTTQWATVIIEHRCPASASYDSFISELRRVFNHPVWNEAEIAGEWVE